MSHMYRLEYNEKAQRQGQSLVLNALLACPRLERLVLINGFIPNDQFEILYQFAKNMEHLIAFCFTSSEMETSAAAELNQKFYDLIIPSRPAFWYYIGDNLSYLDADPTVPRIHYEEIVCPINYFEIPPNFWSPCVSLLPFHRSVLLLIWNSILCYKLQKYLTEKYISKPV